MKLVRAGNLITGYESPDGVDWTVVGSDTFTMGSTVLIGLGVSSHVTGVNATATFDNVTVTEAVPQPPPPNQPPAVTLTSPSASASFTAPATISLARVGQRHRRHDREGGLLRGHDAARDRDRPRRTS